LDTGSGVQFSPDGQRLRNAGYIDDLMIWDAATGAVRLTAPPQSVLNTQWSQAAYWKDGGVHVVTGASAETVILPVISDYLGGVAAFSPAAEMAFFTGQEIQGYSLKNGERILQQSIIGNVPWVAFNAGGTHFAIRKTGQDNSGVLELWETANLQEPVVQSAVPYHGYGEGTLLSPDGQYLSQIGPACGDGGGGAFYLRDIHTWDKLVNWYPGSDCGPYAQVFGPDGTWIMVGWAAYVAVVDITLLDAQTVPPDRQWLGTVVSAMRYNTSRTEIQDLILSPDGSALAVAVTVDQFENERPVPVEQVDIYRFADILERAASQTDTGATFTIPNAHSAAFSPDERWIWTDAGFWDVQGEQRAGVSGQYAAFNPESTLLATADTENVRLWSVDELANGDETPLLTVPLRDVQQIAFSPDGTRLYIQRSGDAQVWGVPPG
ncbi:MAG: WD40 repeat domain-containing protein, partial [Anaerolineae bacterium]|nr:WD40 repeat domain-containing protein [Anaerolineae bacterium]